MSSKVAGSGINADGEDEDGVSDSGGEARDTGERKKVECADAVRARA